MAGSGSPAVRGMCALFEISSILEIRPFVNVWFELVVYVVYGIFLVSNFQESARELQSIDVESGKLQRHLEVCPKDGVTAAVDETSFAESILQLDQSRQRSRDLLQLTRASVVERLERWKLFEDSVNRVLCLIKRLKYARNMATIKGSVDLQRLLSAKQSIEVSHVLSIR